MPYFLLITLQSNINRRIDTPYTYFVTCLKVVINVCTKKETRMTLKSFFLCLLFLSLPILNAAPTTGENIWHLTAATATAVDELAIAQAACCVGTFTVLQNIQTNISNTCAHIPLTISATGTTISTAGVYCLTNDVAMSYPSTIVINASNVVLDLNNHTVKGSPPPSFTPTIAITINGSLSGVSIINGFITSPRSGGFMTQPGDCIQIGNSLNILLDNITLYDCGNCVNVDSTAQDATLIFKNLIMENANTAINISNYKSCVITDCIANGAGAMRVKTTVSNPNFNGTQVTFYNCAGNGFNVINTNAAFENCTASGGTGFDLNIPNNISSTNPVSPCSFTLNNCSSIKNSFGYKLSNQNNATSTIILKAQFNNCKAVTCGAGGYIIDQDTYYLQTSHVNCTAESCAFAASNTAGFDFGNVAPGSTSKCNVQNCLATNNQYNGFQGNNSTQIIFCNNQAFQNGTNYFNLGLASAPEQTLTSTTRLWGDNLKN